ncbi:MAG: AAA family ATPase [Pseudomonadota bacterium]
MTNDLFRPSPMSALNALLRGGLAPGQLGMVMARAGVGKSAFLVHIAIGHLIRGAEVLHVSLQDPAAHVRSFYDEILSELARASGEDAAQARVEVERNRVIHAFLDGAFTPEHLTRLLATLDEVMSFRPAVVILDGALEADDLEAGAWRRFAQDAGIRIWGSCRLHREGGAPAEELAERFDTAVLLAPQGGEVELRVLRAGGEPVAAPPTLFLDPVTMLFEDEQPEAAGKAAPSPAPHTVTLVSGGATGAECAFGEAAERWGLAEVNLTFAGHPQTRARGSRTLTEKELRRGAVSMAYVNRHLERTWDRHGPIAQIVQVQWHLVSQVRQLFVVGAIREDGTVTGGTGWSVELAKRWNRPVWVFCQERRRWHTWNGAAWVQNEPVIETTAIGGTGTRFLTEAGRAAIEGLFARSFGG